MKSNAQATPYFSAYPLKALTQSSQNDNGNGMQPTRVVGRLRVLPMTNPYPEKVFSANSKPKIEAGKEHSEDSEWNNNYE